MPNNSDVGCRCFESNLLCSHLVTCRVYNSDYAYNKTVANIRAGQPITFMTLRDNNVALETKKNLWNVSFP